MNPREIRQRSGLPLIAAAVGAGVSEHTAKLYELDQDVGVKDPAKRKALDRFYARLHEKLLTLEPERCAG